MRGVHKGLTEVTLSATGDSLFTTRARATSCTGGCSSKCRLAAISGGFDFASRAREPEPVRPPRPIPEPPVRPRIYPCDRRARLEAPVAASTSLPPFQPVALNQHRDAQAERPGVLPDDLAIHLPPPQRVRHPIYSSSAVSSTTTYPRTAPGGIYTFEAIGAPVRSRYASSSVADSDNEPGSKWP
jgi:hypothetical protein